MKELKLRAGNYMVPTTAVETNGRLFIHFPFNRILLAEIKAMEGAQWHGHDEGTHQELCFSLFQTNKVWSVKMSQRNRFSLSYMTGNDPYTRWDAPPAEYEIKRPLYDHQKLLVRLTLSRKYMVWAAEMGTGKSAAAIEVMDATDLPCWFVAPKSALLSVEHEIRKWKPRRPPRLLTPEQLKKVMSEWRDGDPPPPMIFLDESHVYKTPTAQRTQAAKWLADGIRDHFGGPDWWTLNDSVIVLMTGSPAPKGPDDWWAQAEIAAPGFIKEGKINAFREGLGIFDSEESAAGWKYKKRVTWLDNPAKCRVCGILRDEHNIFQNPGIDHQWVESVDEITRLNKRLGGLTTFVFKRDCLDLPEKIYRTIVCEPLPSTLRAARLITKSTPRAAEALILLRELSDGFQYKETENGRETLELPCPKEQVVKDTLEQHLEDGRLAIYAGFQGSVDRCVRIAQSMAWTVIRWDGRGILIQDANGHPLSGDPLDIFNDIDNYPMVCFIGQSDSAGTGLTLTATNEILFYSNSFSNRGQVEARIHRPGSRGAMYTDLIHLPSDQLVLDNLKEKHDVQAITMGDLEATFRE